MKKIGLIMGTTWISSKEYYTIINQVVNDKLGLHNNAEMIMININYQNIENALNRHDWDCINKQLCVASKILEKCGADVLAICANLLHRSAEYIEERIKIPLIHIADATLNLIVKDGINKVGLLGAKSLIDSGIYDKKLAGYGVEIVALSEKNIDYINDIIFNELTKGIFSLKSKTNILEIIYKLEKQGAQGFILGCTEIPLIIKKNDVKTPIYDTMTLHAKAIVNYSLAENKEEIGA